MRAKRFEYHASLAADGTILANGSALRPDGAWRPEHFVLVAVAQCTLASLRFYAKDVEVSGSAEAAGLVTRRDEDGRYALVESEVLLDVSLAPAPPPDELPALLARAEHGCFVGNSLAARPRTVWRVNGEHVQVE